MNLLVVYEQERLLFNGAACTQRKRLGGDEFAVYVEEMDRLGFERFKKRIKNETTFINNRNLEKFNISMSLGCTEVNEDCNIISKLLIKADKELYIAKKNRIMQIHDSKPLD